MITPLPLRVRSRNIRGVYTGLAACLAVLAGCESDNRPCTACPPIEGRYALEFDSTTTTGSCQGVNPPADGTLSIGRQAASLTGSLPPYEDMRGTLYTGGDFTLSGSASTTDGGTPTDRLTVRAVYLAGRDGGVATLDGTMLEIRQRSSPSGATECSISRAFTGTRQ
jgi:hypothetical protein